MASRRCWAHGLSFLAVPGGFWLFRGLGAYLILPTSDLCLYINLSISVSLSRGQVSPAAPSSSALAGFRAPERAKRVAVLIIHACASLRCQCSTDISLSEIGT